METTPAARSIDEAFAALQRVLPDGWCFDTLSNVHGPDGAPDGVRKPWVALLWSGNRDSVPRHIVGFGDDIAEALDDVRERLLARLISDYLRNGGPI
jgi:hypothetical protein